MQGCFGHHVDVAAQDARDFLLEASPVGEAGLLAPFDEKVYVAGRGVVTARHRSEDAHVSGAEFGGEAQDVVGA